MDRWKFFDVCHRDHLFCNPLSTAKVDELIELLRLPAGARVLDVASGKAEFLVRLAERYGIAGVGVDVSPYCVRDARAKAAARLPGADLTLVEAEGAAHLATLPPNSFDLAICLGASWIFGGHAGTLRALAGCVRPGGLVLAGEPFWRREPEAAYLQAAGLGRDEFATHAGNVQIGCDQGLTPLYSMVSGEDDWDRYEALQWQAAERYAAAHGEDPDVPEILARQHRARDAYLRWGRDCLGWAVYMFATTEV